MEHIEITVKLPKLTRFATRAGTEFAFDWSRIKPDNLAAFVVEAAETGVAKTAIDAGSGAKAFAEESEKDKDAETVDAETARKILIGKKMNAFYETQEFGARAGGVNLSGEGSAIDYELVAMFKELVAAKVGEKAWKKLSATDQKAEAVKAIEAQSADAIAGLLPECRERAERRKEERDRKAAEREAAAARLAALDVKIKL